MTRPIARRASVGGALAALVVGLLAMPAGTAAAAQSPAESNGFTVDDATLTWGINGYAQNGIFGPWTLTNFSGDATKLEDTSDYRVDPQPATSLAPGVELTNAVRLINGTGTVDPYTGAASLSWSGSFNIRAYPASVPMPEESFADFELDIEADGSGVLTAEVGTGDGETQDGEPIPGEEFGRLKVAEFEAGSLSTLTADGFRLTPRYQGVVNGKANQSTECTAAEGSTGWWGSWPAEFVNAIDTALASHYFSTGCGGKQDEKPALPIDIGYSVDKQDSSVDLSVTSVTYGQRALARAQVAVGGVAPTGTVTIQRGNTVLGTPVLRDGVAQLRLPRTLTTGTHQLTASFAGDPFATAGVASATLRVTKAPAKVAAKVAKKRVKRGKRVRLAIRVGSPVKGVRPTAGKVRVKMRGFSKVVKINKAGKARVVLPARKRAGKFKVVVTYRGAANFKAARTRVVQRVVR